MEPDEAKDAVLNFLGDAKQRWARQADQALREIAKLGFFSRWKAKRIAQKVLGIGPYWNQGFKNKQKSPPEG